MPAQHMHEFGLHAIGRAVQERLRRQHPEGVFWSMALPSTHRHFSLMPDNQNSHPQEDIVQEAEIGAARKASDLVMPDDAFLCPSGGHCARGGGWGSQEGV